jgi:hypothetical protein
MKRTNRPRCPVCLRPVFRTTNGNIPHHRDSLGRDVCPAAGEPYSITGAAA